MNVSVGLNQLHSTHLKFRLLGTDLDHENFMQKLIFQSNVRPKYATKSTKNVDTFLCGLHYGNMLLVKKGGAGLNRDTGNIFCESRGV